MKIIPIFIPHAGCPYKCVYCDQHRISGAVKMPTVKEVKSIIKRNLKTISKDEDVEVAFFGGTFTFLPESLQKEYLDAAYPYTLRMSTHPEAVSLKAMKVFKKKGGRLVELGIQSLDKGVLKNIKRETSTATIKNAARYIKKAGLKLGVQIMLGLPGDTLEKSIKTAKELIKLKPETVRIYPTLVIKGTELAKMRYKPLSLKEAIHQATKAADIFEAQGVKVIRIGLHPSRDLASRKTVIAGPYHPAFGEMVRSRQMRNKIIGESGCFPTPHPEAPFDYAQGKLRAEGSIEILRSAQDGPFIRRKNSPRGQIIGLVKDRYVANRSRIEVHVPRNMVSFVSGHKGSEKKFLERYFGVSVNLFHRVGGQNGHLRGVPKVMIRDIRRGIAVIDPRMPKKAKEKLKRLNYYIAEVPFHKRLARPVRGHVDMMLFRHGGKVIYEPQLEDIANLLRQNGYRCIKGEKIKSEKYPKDIIYNACAVDNSIIHYKGRIEKNIKKLKLRHLPISQGYAKCSIVPVNKRAIITSDSKIRDIWVNRGRKGLLVKPGHVKLPGYKTGFIGGASGVNDRVVFFVGSLKYHPDGGKIRDFIRGRDKGIIELYDGPLYDVGTVLFFSCKF